MSTGADAKTMPVTREYEEGHARTFPTKPVKRGTFVMRCSVCDGVELEPNALLSRCSRCGQDAQGMVDISIAPPLQQEAAIHAPVMVDRFMEGSVATDGTDISSRSKRKEYMRRNGLTDKSDYGKDHTERVRAASERQAAETTKRTVADVVRLDPRHVRKYIEEKK